MSALNLPPYLRSIGSWHQLAKLWTSPVGMAETVSSWLKKDSFVDAVDISKVATDQLTGRHPNINVICKDLDTWDIPPDCYELIVNIRFLDRRLFPMIQGGLKPGGILIFESFMDGKKDKYCLKKNELLRAFQSLRVVYYEEKKIAPDEKFDQISSLVAVKTRKSSM